MPSFIGRRAFFRSVAAATGAAAIAGPNVRSAAGAQGASEWGGPVLDTHLHPRATAEETIAHLDGAGVTKAVILASAVAEARARLAVSAYPSRLIRFAAIDVTQPDAIDYLRRALGSGAKGLGEIKSQVASAGPEMQRVYSLA